MAGVQDGEAATEPENPGCYSQASDQVYGSGADYERWESINQQINELYERIESDPRVLAATEAWSECMAEAGFPGMTEIYSGSETVSERRAAMTREGDSLAGESPLSTAPPSRMRSGSPNYRSSSAPSGTPTTGAGGSTTTGALPGPRRVRDRVHRGASG